MIRELIVLDVPPQVSEFTAHFRARKEIEKDGNEIL